MKLFHIFQTENIAPPCYFGAVVAAPDYETAQKMHPIDGELFSEESKDDWGMEWASSPENVTAEYLGEAKPDTEQGVILSDHFDD